jgi:hypothetical protein
MEIAALVIASVIVIAMSWLMFNKPKQSIH